MERKMADDYRDLAKYVIGRMSDDERAVLTVAVTEKIIREPDVTLPLLFSFIVSKYKSEFGPTLRKRGQKDAACRACAKLWLEMNKPK